MRSVLDSRGFFYSFNVRNEGRAPLLRASLSIALLGHMSSWGVALEGKAEQT